MKPYYDHGGITIYHGNCLEILPTIVPCSIELIATDPPYGKVRGDFDEKWTNRDAMLDDCKIWFDAMLPALAENGTPYWFAWPSLAGRIESIIAEQMNLLAHIIWLKPAPFAQKHSAERLRAPGPETERIIMAEHYGADSYALGKSGYKVKCDDARGFIFEPLRSYLAGEMEAAGHTVASVNKAWRAVYGGNGGMASHWFTSSQWAIPTRDNYAWLQDLFNGIHGEHLQKDYDVLRKDYDVLRKDYEELRRFFDLAPGDPKTDIWRFSPEQHAFDHPTVKPIALMRFIARISCRPGRIILDPFMGSGTTLRAAKDMGRRAIGIEIEERWCEMAAKRMAQEVLQFEVYAGEKSYGD